MKRRGTPLFLILLCMGVLVPTMPASAHPIDHWHRQWVTHTVYEQFGVTASMLEAGMTFDMSYTDNDMENVVEDASHQRCYVSSFPGWHTNDCTYLTYGPGIPQADGFGHFYHTSQIEYRLYATTYSYGSTWNASCAIQEGSLPPRWYDWCDAFRDETSY